MSWFVSFATRNKQPPPPQRLSPLFAVCPPQECWIWLVAWRLTWSIDWLLLSFLPSPPPNWRFVSTSARSSHCTPNPSTTTIIVVPVPVYFFYCCMNMCRYHLLILTYLPRVENTITLVRYVCIVPHVRGIYCWVVAVVFTVGIPRKNRFTATVLYNCCPNLLHTIINIASFAYSYIIYRYQHSSIKSRTKQTNKQNDERLLSSLMATRPPPRYMYIHDWLQQQQQEYQQAKHAENINPNCVMHVFPFVQHAVNKFTHGGVHMVRCQNTCQLLL